MWDVDHLVMMGYTINTAPEVLEKASTGGEGRSYTHLANTRSRSPHHARSDREYRDPTRISYVG